MIDRTPVPRDQRTPLPAFDPVPRRKPRHDGWTPTRQVAFIEALADTGSVTRAAAQVNMSTESAYCLRRQPGAEGFADAWEAALDMGVLRLKDEAFDRAMNGQLVPVIVGGKLIGYRRCRNDRLLTFVLRHYGANPQAGGFRRAQPKRERAPAALPATPSATTIIAAFTGFDLDDRAQDEIIAVLTAGAARARLLMEDKNPAYDPEVPFIHECRMPFDHPEAVHPSTGPGFFPVGDADKGDQCWRMLDLPDERDERDALAAPVAALPAGDEPPHEALDDHPAPEPAEGRRDRLARFARFLASGRPLDEWTEWRE